MRHSRDAGFHKITRAQVARIEQLANETGADLPTSWRGYSKDNAALLIRQLQAEFEPKSYAKVPKPKQTRLL